MLNLVSHRLDYGEQLRAPKGYTLDSGIATTFSLDLEALVGASLALGLDHTLEGDLSGERLALLECLDKLQGRLLVFYQRGNVKVPQAFNRLFTLVEPLLVPSVAMDGSSGAFASFHPKVWLLRFAPLDNVSPVLLRMLVLSRNLTFDRSWDIGVALDGKVLDRGGNGDHRLEAFLRSLPLEQSHRDLVEEMCQSLNAVQWVLPAEFNQSQFKMLPGQSQDASRNASIPFDLDGRIDELLVISPFVDANPTSLLSTLAGRTRGSKTLISRADTLDAIGKEALSGWTTQSLSKLVVQGEERLEREQPFPQDLHAKLIVVKQGDKAIWHVGSANLTDAAFGRPSAGIQPRNREFMLRFEGSARKAGPRALLEEWAATKAFESHEYGEFNPTATQSNNVLRQLIYGLTSARWNIKALEVGDATYSVQLSITPLPTLPAGYQVTVGLLCLNTMTPLAEKISWSDIRLTDISAFISVAVTSDGDSETHRFAVQAVIDVDGLLEVRKRAIFTETVGTKEKLLRYLTLLLEADASKAKWYRADQGGDGGSIFEFDGHGALYEQLLRAASRSPERLSRALYVLKRVHEEGFPLPEGLSELLDSFAPFGRGDV